MKTAGVTHSLNKGKTSVLCQIFGKMKIYKKNTLFFVKDRFKVFILENKLFHLSLLYSYIIPQKDI